MNTEEILQEVYDNGNRNGIEVRLGQHDRNLFIIVTSQSYKCTLPVEDFKERYDLYNALKAKASELGYTFDDPKSLAPGPIGFRVYKK